VLSFRVIVPVRASYGAPARRPIRGICIHELIPLKRIGLQELLCSLSEELIFRAELPGEEANDRWVSINPNVDFGTRFVPQNSPTSKVRLDVNPVRWNQVNQLLKAAELPARISHGRTLVRSDEEVKIGLAAKNPTAIPAA
jgi:hypothetical protein